MKKILLTFALVTFMFPVNAYAISRDKQLRSQAEAQHRMADEQDRANDIRTYDMFCLNRDSENSDPFCITLRVVIKQEATRRKKLYR